MDAEQTGLEKKEPFLHVLLKEITLYKLGRAGN